MGKYRLGEIICMTRKSLAITQEELCHGICSVETLSRVENGKQTPSKETYELLMLRMGRSSSRAFSVLSISNYSILDKLKLFEDNIALLNYEAADKVLKDIKTAIGDTDLDRQFLLRAEALINFRLNRISAQEFLGKLMMAIRITLPHYGVQPLAGWPLNIQEAIIILNISTAYAYMNNYEKCIRILEEVIKILEQSYMDDQQRVLQTSMLSNLAKWYGLTDKHDKAIQVAKEGIKICKTYKIGHVLPALEFAISWNMLEQIYKKIIPESERHKAFQYLKRSYYISSAMHHPIKEKLIIDAYNDDFKGYIDEALLI